jgi:predicted amidohydrolase
MDIVFGQKDLNLKKAGSLAEAAVLGVNEEIPHIICYPELFSTGYDLSNINDHSESIPEGKTTKFLQKMALNYSAIIIASYIEKQGEKFYNTAVVIDEKGIFKGKYRKIHLFPLNPLDETDLFSSGNLFVPSFKLSWGNLGLLLCFDVRFPELSRRMTLEGKIDLLVYLAEFPNPRDTIWTTLLRARAMENQIFVSGVNRVGEYPIGDEEDKKISFFGRSVVYDPLGNILVEGSGKEEILTTKIDPEKLLEARNILPSLKYRRPDYY